jgi:hypothetical protein
MSVVCLTQRAAQLGWNSEQGLASNDHHGNDACCDHEGESHGVCVNEAVFHDNGSGVAALDGTCDAIV